MIERTDPVAAVITAIYDDYDEAKVIAPQRGLDIDWVLVTDNPTLRAPTGWRVIVEPRPGLHPNRAAKGPKLFPHHYTAATASVWVDASFRITSPDFVRAALNAADPIAQFVHPWRDCIYDEAAESLLLAKYDGEPIAAQAQHYSLGGHPEHWGLWATGVIARWHVAETRDLGWAWSSEIARWSYQDQLSEPPVLRRLGLRPSPLEGDHLTNPWLEYHASTRHHVG